MGTSFQANSAVVISPESLAELLPEETQRFMSALASAKLTPEEFCFIQYRRVVKLEDGVDLTCKDLHEEVKYYREEYGPKDHMDVDAGEAQSNADFELCFEAFGALQTAFAARYKLELDTMNNESQSQYDELIGVAFIVNGVYQKTPAAEAIAKHLTDVRYCTFG